jgi:hypothetical protein
VEVVVAQQLQAPLLLLEDKVNLLHRYLRADNRIYRLNKNNSNKAVEPAVEPVGHLEATKRQS